MYKKQIIKLNEAQLKKIIMESVKKVLNNINSDPLKEEVDFGTAYKAYNKMKKLGQDKRAEAFHNTFKELRNKDDINYDLENGDLIIGGKYAPRRGEEGFYGNGRYEDSPRTDDRRKARAWADAANKYRKHFSPNYSKEFDKNDFIAESN